MRGSQDTCVCAEGKKGERKRGLVVGLTSCQRLDSQSREKGVLRGNRRRMRTTRIGTAKAKLKVKATSFTIVAQISGPDSGLAGDS